MLKLSINNLHQESLEWIDLNSFWKDEMIFLKDLLFLRVNPSQIGDEAYRLNEKFTEFSERINQLLQDKLQNHEYKLKTMQTSQSIVDSYDYTEKHKELVLDMKKLNQDMMNFKKELIFYYKNWLDI